MKIYVKLEAPFEWARVVGSNVEAFGEVEDLQSFPITEDDEVIGVVPGEWVTTHTVNLPTKTRKQFNQALPFALEDAISEDVSNIHFICPAWKAAEEVTVLSVAKDKMAYWQTLANSNRLPITKLLPDHALVPFHEVAECSLAIDESQVYARHQELGGVSLDTSLVNVWLMEVPMASTIAVNDEELTQQLIDEHPNRDFRHWPFGNKMRHWLEYPIESDIDLWGDNYRPHVSRFNTRMLLKPLALAAVALGLVLCYDVYRYVSLHREIAKLDANMLQVLNDTIPGVQGIEGGHGRDFMEKALRRGQSQSVERSVHATLADAAKVLRRLNATVIELTYQNNELLLTCVLADFSQVDALAKQLNSRRTLTAKLQGSAAEDGKIIATYSVKEK